MPTFLEETLLDIKRTHTDLSSLTLILPSKRAGGFLKNYLRKLSQKTEFAPKIISIEEFLEDLSDLQLINSTELIFKSYEAYLQTHTHKEKEDFDTYSSWATTLLNDFNEIDRYLVEPKSFFSYLGSIKTLEKWNVQDEKTELIEKYLSFWESLFDFYQTFKATLLSEGVGYQGLLYREASEAVEHYIAAHGDKPHIFIGFNALNTAEQHIIQALLETGNSDIYWDVDAYFYDDKKHSASLFVRNYFSSWKHFEQATPKNISSNFTKPKEIHFVEVQKNIGQAKYVGELLSTLSEEELQKTAVVLADENLLIPLLHSLPANVKNMNVTMGVTLKNVPMVVFFEQLLAQHVTPRVTLYYKDVLALLKHPIGIVLVPQANEILARITKKNLTHFTVEELLTGIDATQNQIISILFGDWQDTGKMALEACLSLLYTLKEKQAGNTVERVVLFQLHQMFTTMLALDQKFPHLKTVKTVQSLFLELAATTTLDFEGNAYEGLQVMGILETRVLDFERVIMTSVNEGILPAGKSNASFITYDLKKEFHLPLYVEKDAVYTYHFYRLLHRARHVTLLYNTHSEGINTGEKSRFLLQLEIEKHPQHKLTKTVLTPAISIEKRSLKTVAKTEDILERIKEIAFKGFSPSALTSYIRNPIDFYYQKILRVNDFEEVEETVAANTLGTIVHDTLETLYKPSQGEVLTQEALKKMQLQIEDEVTRQFKLTFKGGTFTKGKNLIIFEVAKRYVTNLIQHDLAEIKAGNEIKLLHIEENIKCKVAIETLDFPVHIGGKVDRVDMYNGVVRIIDYKTGKVAQGDVEIIHWEDITTEYKYSKAFQVLAYATMITDTQPYNSVEAGIISFKNMQGGFLKFGTKTSAYSPRDHTISTETTAVFSEELKKLILEICNPEIPFTEKEV